MFTYKGKKIKLRPLQLADKERSIIWRNDPEIRDMALSYRFPVTEVMEDNWYKKAMTGEDSSKVFFAIETISDGKHIGFIHLYNIDYIAANAYFGVTIGEKSEHGKGKATEAMHIIFQFAFKHLNMHKINLEVASFNRRAIDLYHKFGFQTEGVLREQLYISGQYYDKYCMGIFRDEYFKKYPQHLFEEANETNDKRQGAVR
jgi:diamine N-acetyltransferase